MPKIIKTLEDAISYSIEDISIEEYWNVGNETELTIHSIHAYPAKFPAFITNKAIKLAVDNGITVDTVSDIFCGCGTVALECKKNNVNFWGCDINPVATLITKAKTYSYDIKKLRLMFDNIKRDFLLFKFPANYSTANDRIRYWFYEEQYNKLFLLKKSIENNTKGKYKTAFLCLFSSILKPTSKWLTKAIKPQIDPNKKPAEVWETFEKQFNKFVRGLQEIPNSLCKIDIDTCSVLTKRRFPNVDLIITSPPYVTSYEYADLHQLSSLWLDYTDDYTCLRKGTMGSAYNCETFFYNMNDLNNTARKIITSLQNNKDIAKSKIKPIARYYIDMQKAAMQCYKMLKSKGLALFIIGDTEYKGTKIHNSQQLVESLIQSGFSEVMISKRRISNKILTPYRDINGKFTSDKTKREIYHEEFVVIGRKELYE